MHQKLIISFILSCFFYFSSAFFTISFSQNNIPIGQMEDIINDVLREDLRTKFQPKTKIILNDKVITKEDSLANAEFDDGSLISIGPDSSVTIDQWVYNPNTSLTDGAINLGKGFLRYASSNSGVNKVKLTSNAVTLSLRGTVLDLAKDRDQSAVGVLSGEVEATTKFGNVLIPEGSFYIVSSDNPQGSILTSPPEFLLNKMNEAVDTAMSRGKNLIFNDMYYPKMPNGKLLELSTDMGKITFCMKENYDKELLSSFLNYIDSQPIVLNLAKSIPNYALLFNHIDFRFKKPLTSSNDLFFFGSLGLIKQSINVGGQLFISLNRYKSLDGHHNEIARANSGLDILYKIKQGELSFVSLGTMTLGLTNISCSI